MELADECACGERGRPPAAVMRALGAVTPYMLLCALAVKLPSFGAIAARGVRGWRRR